MPFKQRQSAVSVIGVFDVNVQMFSFYFYCAALCRWHLNVKVQVRREVLTALMQKVRQMMTARRKKKAARQ